MGIRTFIRRTVTQRDETDKTTRSGREGPVGDGLRTPDEVIDSSTWAPANELGLAERLKRRRRALATFGVLGLVLIGLLYAYMREFAITLATSTPVQVGALLVVTGGVTYLVGLRAGRREVHESDWLVARLPGGVKRLLGEFSVAPDGTNVFVPYRGFDELSGKSRPLTLDELGMGDSHAKKDRELARIRVDDGDWQVEETAHGTIVSVVTDGFETDTFGRHSDVYATPPSRVDDEQVRSLQSQYQNMRDEVRRLDDRLDATRRENAELRDWLRKRRGEILDEFTDRAVDLTPILNGRPRRAGSNRNGGDGHRRNGVDDRESPPDDGMTLDDAGEAVAGDTTLDEAGPAGSGGGSR